MLLSRNWFLKFSLSVTLAAIVVTLLVLSPTPQSHPVQAQGGNLITNPGFDSTWYGKTGVDGQIPTGWDIWGDGLTPATDRNIFADTGNAPRILSNPASWIMKGGFVAWTGGGLQRVNVTLGATYRFSIYGFVWTCNDLEFSCTGPSGRTSDKSFGGRVKVGIDPFGGTDPKSSNIIWSASQEAYDAFLLLSVDAVAQSSTITVFTYTTVSAPPALREVYWEDASLVETVPTDPNAIPGAATAAPPTPAYVPFVSPQNAQPDGSVVHIVGEGDTFASILVAYRTSGATRETVLSLNGWDLPPSLIVPGDRILILPPGSVDPTTGRLLTGGQPIAPVVTSVANSGVAPTVTPLAPPATGGTNPTPLPTNTSTNPTVPEQGPPSTINRGADVEKGGILLEGNSPPFFSLMPFAKINTLNTSLLKKQNASNQLCVQFFLDQNYNTLFDSEESSISGGSITLLGNTFPVQDTSGLGCLTEIPPQTVTITITPPTNFFLLRSNQVVVELQSDSNVTLYIGLIDTPLPTPISNVIPPNTTQSLERDLIIARKASSNQTAIEQFYQYSGYIVLGIAAFIGIASILFIRFYR